MDISFECPYIIDIYSLPFPLDQFTIIPYADIERNSNLWRSNRIYSFTNIYANVKTLRIEKCYDEPDEKFEKVKIFNLIIDTYFVHDKWFVILPNLRHLSLEHDGGMSSKNFRILLDSTPHLYSLEMKKIILQRLTDNWNNISVCKHLSDKIRCLKFHSNVDQSQSFNKSELYPIMQIFTSKCEHLSLSIQSEIDTIDFILRHMRQLHSLHVHIIEKDHPSVTMKWLDQQQTDSNCIIVKEEQDYYFWLGKYP